MHILHINYHFYIATGVLHALSTKFSKATIVTRENVFTSEELKRRTPICANIYRDLNLDKHVKKLFNSIVQCIVSCC